MRAVWMIVMSLAVLGWAHARQAAITPIAGIHTVPEKTDFNQTSPYADVVAFLEAVDRASPRVHLTTFGETHEKRALPLAVAGAAAATADAVKRTGKLRVYIQGNIHGGEVEGKESAQMLVRDVAAGQHDDWLERMVLLVAPVYNADGNERFALDNRGPQNGPLGGQGQRPNAQGLDLNRDHMKLDSPEARAFVRLMNDFDPHVVIDLHTTNGSRHAYHLTYAPPLHPGTDAAIVDLLRQEWLPSVTAGVREKHGWEFYYYGNVWRPRPGAPAAERRWVTFDHRPRFNNNYVGLRNRFAVLSEAYAYASFRDRILATSRFIEENLRFLHDNADRVASMATAADRTTIVGRHLPLRAELQHTGTITVLMGEVDETKHPVDGHLMHIRKDVKTPETMADYSTFKGTEPERVPAYYYVPADLVEAVDRLKAHGIALTVLQSTADVTVEEFRIDSVQAAAAPFQGRHEHTVTGSWVAAKRRLPAGTLRIDVAGPRGRLAFYLVEPRSDDGLLNWNLLAEALTAAKVYPILRSR